MSKDTKDNMKLTAIIALLEHELSEASAAAERTLTDAEKFAIFAMAMEKNKRAK